MVCSGIFSNECNNAAWRNTVSVHKQPHFILRLQKYAVSSFLLQATHAVSGSCQCRQRHDSLLHLCGTLRNNRSGLSTVTRVHLQNF